MKKLLLLIKVIFALALLYTDTYAQDYQWTETAGGIYNDALKAIVTDKLGNVYYTGYFTGSYDFDGSAGVDIHNCAGSTDFFVVKKDIAGNYLWTKTFGNAGSDRAYSIATDSLGNIIIGGNFQNTLDFDLGAGNATYTPTGQYDAFILKLDSNGDFLWVKTFGGAGASTYPLSMQCDNNGNIINAGVYAFASIDANPGINVASLPFYGGTQDIYIQKLDFNGNFIWSASAGGTGVDRANSLALDNNGNCYIAGYFQGTVDFNTGPLVDNRIAAFDDGFLLKLDASGNYVNCVTSGGSSNEQFTSVYYSEFHNGIFIAGYFAGTVDFDYSTSVVNLTSTGSTDGLVQLLDLTFNNIWAKATGGNFATRTYAVTVDRIGNIYSAGRFEVSLDIDPGLGTDYRNSNGSFDCYIQRLDELGNYNWGITFGGSGSDEPSVLNIHNPGDLYAGGVYSDSLDFNPFIGIDSISAIAVDDAFISKYTFCANSTNNITETVCNSYTLNALTYTTSGNYTQTFVNATGCDSIITLNLTVNTVDDSVTVGGASFIANSSTGTYQWIDCTNGNIIITGSTSQTYSPGDNNYYAVIITDNGCVDTSACVNMLNVGLNEIFSPDLIIFPNPLISETNITFSETQANTVIKLINLLGEVVKEFKFSGKNIKVERGNLNAGIYIVQTISEKNKVSNFKIVLQ